MSRWSRKQTIRNTLDLLLRAEQLKILCSAIQGRIKLKFTLLKLQK